MPLIETPEPAPSPTTEETGESDVSGRPLVVAGPDQTITLNPAPFSAIRVPQDQPTIQAGIDAAQDGDLVLVSPGTYTEQLILSGKTITLTSQFHTTGNPDLIDQTIIDGGGQTVITVTETVGPETKIAGFTIQNGDDGIRPFAKLHILNNRFVGHKDAIDYEAGGGVCRNNVFENNSDDAIDLDGPTEAIIEDNVLRNSGDDGIEIRLHKYSGPTLNIIIRNNIIASSNEDGIQLIDHPGVSDRVFLIERNLIADSAMVGLGLMDNRDTNEDFRAASILDRIHLFNNTFVDNGHGVSGGDNLIALNNLFVNTTNIALKGVDGDSIAAYNLFWNNGIDNQGSNIDNDTTLSADPLLDSEYHLQQGSPAIDAGTAYFEWQAETVLDLPRSKYFGSAPDLGMHESSFMAPVSVTVSGPSKGAVNSAYTFTASVSPITVTQPISYIWQATGQSLVTNTADLSNAVIFTWSLPGPQVITATAANVVDAVINRHIITIEASIYLPIMLNNASS